MSPLAALFIRDIRLAIRVGGGGGIGVLFFLIVVVLMPFAIGPELTLLTRLGPAILWLGALLASLLTLDRLFAVDHEDGSLDLILMSDTPLELAVAAKAAAHWLTTGLPLIIATPLLGLFMNLDAKASAAVMLTLLAGTPALTFIGLIGAALSVALRRGGLLLAVLVLPLTVPVLIFGVAASNAAIIGPLPFGTPFTILCALMLTSLVVGIFVLAFTFFASTIVFDYLGFPNADTTWMDADDPDARLPRLRGGGDAANQRRIADGDDDGPRVRHVVQNLRRHRSGANRNLRNGRIVEHERAGSLGVAIRRAARVREIGSGFLEPRTETRDRLRLDGIRIARQKDRRRDSVLLRGVCDRRSVIAGARGHDLADRAALHMRRERVQRAAHLEGSGRQLALEFEEEIRGDRRRDQTRWTNSEALNHQPAAFS